MEWHTVYDVAEYYTSSLLLCTS